MGINFQKFTWTDRLSQYPTRRKLAKFGEDPSTAELYTIERDDNPTSEGVPFSASAMNNMENRIANITVNVASSTANGLMKKEDFTKLNGIQAGATKNSITRGTSAPSGGNDGDIYLRY